MFYCCYTSCSNYVDGSSSTSHIVIILRDDPFEHLFLTPAVVALLDSSKPLENLSGAKNSRLGTLKESFTKMFFENLGVVLTPLRCFQKVVSLEQREVSMKKRGVGGFQMTLVITRYPPEQLTCATTLPRYGMGLSPKFICLGAGSLILYKGSWYLGNLVRDTPESGLSPSMGQYISRHIPSQRKTLGFSRRGAGVML
jgi:hypothetical protein